MTRRAEWPANPYKLAIVISQNERDQLSDLAHASRETAHATALRLFRAALARELAKGEKKTERQNSD
jgi:hypothetical protein